MFDLSGLLQQGAAPLWAFAGVLGVKLFDWMLARRKSEGDHTVQVFQTTNAAQQALVEGLFAQIKLLQQDVSSLKDFAEAQRRRAEEAETKLRSMEMRLQSYEQAHLRQD